MGMCACMLHVMCMYASHTQSFLLAFVAPQPAYTHPNTPKRYCASILEISDFSSWLCMIIRASIMSMKCFMKNMSVFIKLTTTFIQQPPRAESHTLLPSACNAELINPPTANCSKNDSKQLSCSHHPHPSLFTLYAVPSFHCHHSANFPYCHTFTLSHFLTLSFFLTS